MHPFLEAFSSLLYFAYPVFQIIQCPPFFTDTWSFFQGTLSNLDFGMIVNLQIYLLTPSVPLLQCSMMMSMAEVTVITLLT